MDITRKDASIANTGNDDEFPGAFEVVLSTPALDRDGDELAAEDWKMPLPEHITFDMDHGMSVATTVGSGVPTLEDGRLVVRGSYSSLPRAQEVRTLVKEGHIRTTSVAFMSEKESKGGKSRTVRELLNGAFVAIPANREAVVLSAKAGARNSSTDQSRLQAAHDALVAAGASCPLMDDTGAEDDTTGGKAASGVTTKAKYSAEQLRQMLADGHALRGPDGEPDYPIGDREDLENAIRAVGRGSGSHDAIRAYIVRRAKELGLSDLIPPEWSAEKDAKIAEVKALVRELDETERDTLLDELADIANWSVEDLTGESNEELDKSALEAAEKAAPVAEDAASLDAQYKALSISLAANLAE